MLDKILINASYIACIFDHGNFGFPNCLHLSFMDKTTKIKDYNS